ncbi:hypothetical protein IG631_19035 [Alternaria alternata]|nr:hypothetical protein IG631_19035 [Alternaria alternata]
MQPLFLADSLKVRTLCMSSKILHLGIADCDPCSARGVDASQTSRHGRGCSEQNASCGCHSLQTLMQRCFLRKHSVVFRNPARSYARRLARVQSTVGIVGEAKRGLPPYVPLMSSSSCSSHMSVQAQALPSLLKRR